jgi:hypothetical protein
MSIETFETIVAMISLGIIAKHLMLIHLMLTHRGDFSVLVNKNLMNTKGEIVFQLCK